MDFAKELKHEESVASKSGIRYIIPTHKKRRRRKQQQEQELNKGQIEEGGIGDQDPIISSSGSLTILDEMVIDAANEAAKDLLQIDYDSSSSEEEEEEDQEDNDNHSHHDDKQEKEHDDDNDQQKQEQRKRRRRIRKQQQQRMEKLINTAMYTERMSCTVALPPVQEEQKDHDNSNDDDDDVDKKPIEGSSTSSKNSNNKNTTTTTSTSGGSITISNKKKNNSNISQTTSTEVAGIRLICPGDLVVIVESFDHLTFCYATVDDTYTNRYGTYHHNDFIGQPYGCIIRSKSNYGYGYIYLLKPTPELWTRSLKHRTQLVHELDQSQIILQLQLRPNMIVVECGTGSGAMSHALIRTIAPHGHLHTYEFNKIRAQTAHDEFMKTGVLPRLVTVHHKDVCGYKNSLCGVEHTQDKTDRDSDNCDHVDGNVDFDNDNKLGGFDLDANSVDAVFLDLPEPWHAVPHAAYVMKLGISRFASYSPCIEQTQRTIYALKKCGFHSIKTMEYRLREHYVDEIEYDTQIHIQKKPRLQQHNLETYNISSDNKNEATTTTTTTATADTTMNKMDNKSTTNNNNYNNEKATTTTTKSTTTTTSSSSTTTSETTTKKTMNRRKKKVLVTRPFSNMRGHTAFLTFATAGNIKQPNPNSNKNNKKG